MTIPPRSDIPVLAELPLEIVTQRMTLRPVRVDDANAIFAYARDPALPRYMSWAAHGSVDDTRAWLRSCIDERDAGRSMLWVLEQGGTVVGCIGLDGIRWQLAALRQDRAELGYWIGPDVAGQGLMTEAAIAVTRWAFDTMGLHKVTVQCFEPNAASRRVIEKAGFRFIGRAEDDVWRDGQWYAHLKYERVRT